MITRLLNKILKWQGKVVETNNFITDPSGGKMYYNGVHKTHVFTSTGHWWWMPYITAEKFLDVSVFCIGGGGAGGYFGCTHSQGGGGGAGGVSISNIRLSNKKIYNVNIGLGGSTSIGTGHQGQDSYIIDASNYSDMPVVAYGGGSGGAEGYGINNDGGSGGGAWWSNCDGQGGPGDTIPGTPTHYGNNGYNAYDEGGSHYAGGGGGSKIPAEYNKIDSSSSGGKGMILFLTDTSILYAAGGGAGVGGLMAPYFGDKGSGGRGGQDVYHDSTPGLDGIVCIRYPYKDELIGGDDWNIVNIDIFDGDMYADYALHGGYFYDYLYEEDK